MRKRDFLCKNLIADIGTFTILGQVLSLSNLLEL
jgi:hypothetical protein